MLFPWGHGIFFLAGYYYSLSAPSLARDVEVGIACRDAAVGTAHRPKAAADASSLGTRYLFPRGLLLFPFRS